MSLTSGIYRIYNKLNGKSYWGSSKHIEKRFDEHRYKLGVGNHHSRHLQLAWNKYSADAFDFQIMWRTSSDPYELQYEEQLVLNNLKCEYNICPVAGSAAFRKHTDETKRKISAAKSGAGNQNFGKHLSEQHKSKIRASNQGRKLTQEQLEKATDQLRSVARAKVGTGRGYHLHKQTGKWRAVYAINGKRYDLGLFATEEQARAAYLNATKKENS